MATDDEEPTLTHLEIGADTILENIRDASTHFGQQSTEKCIESLKQAETHCRTLMAQIVEKCQRLSKHMRKESD